MVASRSILCFNWLRFLGMQGLVGRQKYSCHKWWVWVKVGGIGYRRQYQRWCWQHTLCSRWRWRQRVLIQCQFSTEMIQYLQLNVSISISVEHKVWREVSTHVMLGEVNMLEVQEVELVMTAIPRVKTVDSYMVVTISKPFEYNIQRSNPNKRDISCVKIWLRCVVCSLLTSEWSIFILQWFSGQCCRFFESYWGKPHTWQRC